ncbi:MAG TPA: hypothetical protein VGS22_21645 [Thermoanaerobaculia bacterium]|jgi:hypothetical protein|nr:hypothetical protein [Thermoanaerobaculia bacterium]
MADEPASESPPELVFEVRGPEPRGPLAERLLRDSPRGLAAAGTASAVLIDGQGAGPDVVREAVAAGLDRPLLLLHAGRQMRAALNLPIAFVDESDAYLVLPERAGAPPRILDFSHLETTSPLERVVPPPDPEPPGTIPDRFFEPNLATDTVANAVTSAITRFQRGEPVPRFGAPPGPDPPKDVSFHRYPSITKTIPVSLADPYYGNDYAKSQEGQIDVTYYVTGYLNFDAIGDFQSYVLAVQLAVGTAVALSGELITRAEREHLIEGRYLGWFQESIEVGLNYPQQDGLLLLGTTPNTINRKISQTTTKGFSVDIGFEADSTGAKPKLGLNYKSEVSTATRFDDWAVGEQTGPFFTGIETVRWRYGIAHPYNSALSGELVVKLPETDTFTPQSTSGFDFIAATALEIPVRSAEANSGRVTFDAILGWNLRYLYRGSVLYEPRGFVNDFSLGSRRKTRIELDLGEIPFT